MLACWIVGRLCGGLLERVVRDHVEQYKEAHPIPPLDLDAVTTGGDSDTEQRTTSGTAA